MRWNSAFAFLDPARGRPNLTIRPGITADRFELDGDWVVGLVCRDGSDEVRIAGRVYVLAAGVFGSPAVLLRSGVGGSEELRRHGIASRVEVPGVGSNLHDHPGVGIRYEPSDRGRAVCRLVREVRIWSPKRGTTWEGLLPEGMVVSLSCPLRRGIAREW